ncbi:MAG: FHA domain-containing protein [Ruminiclostridium sp.]|nr:FHA domain-containing protein [Ruminiclostridium sp.]
MSKITTIPNTENEDNNINISRNTEFYTGSAELNKPEDLTACPSCGSQNLADSNFCIVCGCRLNRPSSDSQAFHSSQVSFAEFSSDRESVNMFKEGNTCLLLGVSPANTVKDPKKGYTDESNGTVTAGCENGERKLVPVLTRTKNGEKTVIEKPMFKIGTSRESCDMVIADNRYISRIHAYIVTRNGRYFIIDRNSTNKTYVNGKAISAETEAELSDNTQVRLANEDMVFNIEYV